MFAMDKYAKDLEKWDQWVRSGKASEVRKELKSLNFAKVPRKFVVSLARMAYRANLSSVSLRVIGRFIKPGK